MESTGMVEALLDFAQRGKVLESLVFTSSDAVTGNSASFEAHLEEAMHRETAGASPAVKEKEKLASNLSASAVMPQQIANLNNFLQEYSELNPEKVSSVKEILTGLRDAAAAGIVSYRDALQKLKAVSGEQWGANNTGGELNLSQLAGEIKERAHNLQHTEAKEELLTEASHLKEMVLRNFSLQAEIAASGAEVWVQQVWPPYQAETLTDNHRRQHVPYNPDRNKPEISAADKEVKEWDDKFEAEWSRSEQMRINRADSFRENSSDVLSQGNASASVRPAQPMVPEGERLFAQMVKVMQSGMEGGQRRMNLELHPDYLGSLKLKLSMNGEELSARFLVDNESVRNLLVERMDDLKEALGDKGITMGEVQIAFRLDGRPGLKESMSPASAAKAVNSPLYFENTEKVYYSTGEQVTTGAWVV